MGFGTTALLSIPVWLSKNVNLRSFRSLQVSSLQPKVRSLHTARVRSLLQLTEFGSAVDGKTRNNLYACWSELTWSNLTLERSDTLTQGGGGGGDPHKKKMGSSSYLLGVKVNIGNFCSTF